LLALLLCNKAPKYPFVTTSINISKRDLGALKKEKKKKERKRKIKARGQMSQHRGISSSLGSPQSLQSSKKRYVFLQRSKSRIRYSPSLYPFILTYIYHYHHLPLSPYTHSTHILRTPHMHILI
jgi:hypothetical protein